jgi:hypothetical protein
MKNERLISGRVQLAITLATVAVAVVNAFIAYNLVPLAKDIQIIQSKVSAIELTCAERNEVSIQLDGVADRLDRIENKLDRHLER